MESLQQSYQILKSKLEHRIRNKIDELEEILDGKNKGGGTNLDRVRHRIGSGSTKSM